MMRKLPQHLQDLFQCLVQFLLDVEVSRGASGCGLLSDLWAAEGPQLYAAWKEVLFMADV